MAVTNPYVIFMGGIVVGGLFAGAILGPLTQNYGSVRKAAWVSSALAVALAGIIGFMGVLIQ